MTRTYVFLEDIDPESISSKLVSANSGGQLRISPEVARLISVDIDIEEKRQIVAGRLPFSIHDQVIFWYLVYTGASADSLRDEALQELAIIKVTTLKPVLRDAELDLRVLEFILRARRADLPTLIVLRPNRNIPESVWSEVFSRCSYEVLEFFLDPKGPFHLTPGELNAATRNAQVTEEMRDTIAHQLEQAAAQGKVSGSEEDTPDAVLDAAQEQLLDETAAQMESANKQQLALELNVGDKIKLAMSGDKEWRSIFLKDSNKQVSSAVLKNPRITEKEVLILCQNRSTNDELIRLILCNREWLKNYTIRLALTMHPRTPVNQGIRFLSTLGERDLRTLSKSRNISSVLVNACRRMLMVKSRH
ncbi:MAG: hypothetical protein RBR06_07100 [Desulfuromonadaceae bacterium]|nr:hypothetical protein [Desulfuromonadaceae bacterium]